MEAQRQHVGSPDLCQLQHAVEASGEVIFMTDREGVITFVNREFVQLYGYAPEEVVGVSTPRILKSGLTPVEDYAALWERLARGEVVRGELVNRTKAGDLASIEYSANPVRDGQNGVIGFLAVQRDITERKRIEAALQASEARYRTLAETRRGLAMPLERHAGLLNAVIDGSPIGIAVLDSASFVCNSVNPAFGRLVSDRAMAGVPLKDLWPGDATDVMRMFERVLDTGIPGECVDVQLPRSRTIPDSQAPSWVTVSASPLLLPGVIVPGLLVLVTDTTSRKQLEAQFFQAQKMEAVGRLAGGIAHDFNNLLTAILGYSELLMETFDAGDRRRHDLEEVRRAAESAAALTRHLLTFSRKQIAEPTIVDVNAVVAQFEKIIRRTIGEDVTLNLRLEPTLERILIDAGQLEQILMNLTVNARDAMPRGGTLTITTVNLEVTEANRPLHGHTPVGRYVALAITDTGIGMSDDVQSHLFEPFFTTKEAGKGTGLGLSTVFGIVTQHNGHIDVSSAPGCGTTFSICFPRVERHEAIEADARVWCPLPTGRETILIAEDDDALRALAARTLDGCGYRTLAARNALEAVQMAGEFPGAIDVLVTDVVMPGADGVELARELGRSRPGMRVLYMSGHTDGVISEHGLLKQGVQFLHKPYTRLTLARKVREVLGTSDESPSAAPAAAPYAAH
jgi:PAS domain S-box-containing protein